MSPTHTTAGVPAPADCWYALASSSEVDRHLLPLRALGLPVVLFRTEDGRAVALADRCAHRAYPLSAGVLAGDLVRCGLCGFAYDTEGRCVAVPTQPRVPIGARVAAYPTQERDGLVWVWLGEAGRSRLNRVPELPWLTDDGWRGVGGTEEVAAGFLLLHENFADVTQVPFVAPEIAPAALAGSAPPLEVVVTETTVELWRTFPPAPLPGWQEELLGGGTGDATTVQAGFFLSPAVWADHWDASYDGGSARLRFTQLVTPVSAGLSRLHWRVSRDFALDDPAADARMNDLFRDYYARVRTAMETAQRVLDEDGVGPEVNVAADVAALRVREIVTDMIAEEGGTARAASPTTRPTGTPAPRGADRA